MTVNLQLQSSSHGKVAEEHDTTLMGDVKSLGPKRKLYLALQRPPPSSWSLLPDVEALRHAEYAAGS